MAATASKASRRSTSSATPRMSSWWRGSRGEGRATRSSPPPPVLPDLLADQTGDARLLLGHRNKTALRRPACNFEQQLGADRLLELFAILDRHHEGTGPADHAVLVI